MHCARKRERRNFVTRVGIFIKQEGKAHLQQQAINEGTEKQHHLFCALRRAFSLVKGERRNGNLPLPIYL
jgi:hypothetical protein